MVLVFQGGSGVVEWVGGGDVEREGGGGGMGEELRWGGDG